MAGVAATAVAAWSVTHPRSSPLTGGGSATHAVLVAGIVGAFALYLAGVWLLHGRSARPGAVLAVAAAIQLTPLAAPLLLSQDAYVYWDYGRIAHVHDANPYTALPSQFPDDPAYPLMGRDWHRTTSAYGPAWTLIGEGDAAAAGDSKHAAAWIYRVLGGLSALGLAGVASAAAAPGTRAFAAAFVGWNPLLALHFAGGGHNDALMMALAIGGLALAQRGRRQLGGAAWAAAISIKWLPALALPFVLVRERRRFGYAGFVVAALALGAAATARYGVHWLHAAAPISNQLQRANSLSPVHYLIRAGLGLKVAAGILTAGFAAVYLWLLRAAWLGRPRIGLLLGLFTLTLAWLAPWYAAWPLAFAAIEEDAAARLLALALSAYLLSDAVPL